RDNAQTGAQRNHQRLERRLHDARRRLPRRPESGAARDPRPGRRWGFVRIWFLLWTIERALRRGSAGLRRRARRPRDDDARRYLDGDVGRGRTAETWRLTACQAIVRPRTAALRARSGR